MDEKQFTVLVVDDEPALREVLSLRIRDWGYDVITAAEVAEAERQVEENRPDMVLSDVVLPESCGLDLLKWLKRNGIPSNDIRLVEIPFAQMLGPHLHCAGNGCRPCDD
jgi:CheY-like chemotaxis protein